MRVVLVGFGSVGRALASLLESRRDDLYARMGLSPKLVCVMDSQGAAVSHSGLSAAALLDVKTTTGSVSNLPGSGVKLGGSADEQRLYRCDREGNITCDALADGKRLWTQKLPFGAVLRAAGEQLVCGDKSGRVARIDAGGKMLWQVQLARLHELPGSNYVAHVRAALLRDVDSTPDFFPVSDDQR